MMVKDTDKGKENPILLSDEDGNFIESDIHIPESKKHIGSV
jgi:hypothetical protein